MGREIAKAYEPQQIEPRWAEFWVKEELFKADPSVPGPAFSMVIPPPNVTGSLHIGHMLNHTEIDILTRWYRMRGYNTLYLPGTDHAGIATQRIVARQLSHQGIHYRDLGREEFIKRVWQWKEESGGTIQRQMKQIGESCDWSREKFTLSPELSRVVRDVFVRLYEEGLIYREKRIVNWCPGCRTVLSDLEVVHEEKQGHLWYVKYPVVGMQEFLVVATTRPETMLGDTAVAVHPEDERYKHLIGKRALLPLMNREIPIIGDEMVDREFGTGAVKITPAHDPNDFEAGKRHGLPQIDVMTDDAHINENGGAYAGLERFAARKQIVEDLQAQGYLEKIERAPQRNRTLREKPDDCGATHLDAMVLPNAAPGRAGDCGRGARRCSDGSGEPANGISELDEEYPGLDAFAAVVVGTPNTGVVLRLRRDYCGEGRAKDVPEVRIGQTAAGSGCPGYVVQLGLVAVFDAGLAGEDRRFRKILSDELADHRVRHPVFLGGADDHDGAAFYWASSLSRGVSAFDREDTHWRKDVQVQGDGTGPGGAESTVWNGCDAVLPGVDGGAGNGHCPER